MSKTSSRPSAQRLVEDGEGQAAAGEYEVALWHAAAAAAELAPTDHPAVVSGRVLSLLATCHQCLGRLDRAGELADAAIAALEGSGRPGGDGARESELGAALHLRAIAYLDEQDVERAMPLLERAAQVLEGKARNAVDFCALLLTMAEVSKATGDVDAALGLLRRVLDQVAECEPSSEEHAGALNALTAKAMLGLGGAFGQAGDAHAAKDYLARSLEFFDASFGHGHPEMSAALTEVAAIYRLLGDGDAAAAIDEELKVAARMLDEIEAEL